jgi:hypothetical protein
MSTANVLRGISDSYSPYMLRFAANARLLGLRAPKYSKLLYGNPTWCSSLINHAACLDHHLRIPLQSPNQLFGLTPNLVTARSLVLIRVQHARK